MLDKSKQRTPKKNHPWKRKFIINHEMSQKINADMGVARVNNYLIGGGKTQK